jgi:hypothetical protein
MRYRKKPIQIEAMRWTGTPESASEIIDWALGQGGTIRFHEGQWPYDDGQEGTPGHPPTLTVDTLEGTMTASAGDFVIRGVAGEFYPCKGSIFEASYDPVEKAS